MAHADGNKICEAEIGLFEKDGDSLELNVLEGSRVLFMGGEPIDEPTVGYGPFVMNTKEEINQALRDYQSGQMGQLEREKIKFSY